MWKEFKEFAVKGNVMDLAVAVIIGGAFGQIVTSFVNDLLMPVIGVLLGKVNFTDLKYVITPAVGEAAEVAILYGAFIQAVVDFLIIAAAIFAMVKLLTLHKKQEEEEPEAEPEPAPEVVLLEEIRDLLKEQN